MTSMAQRMRAQRMRANGGGGDFPQQYDGYSGTRGNYGPNEVTGVMGGSWYVPDAPKNGFGCPVGWTGFGDQNPFQIDLLPGGALGEPVVTNLIVQAAFEAAARYVLISTNVLAVDDAGTVTKAERIPEGFVFINSARTANGPDAIFNSANSLGCDVTYFERNSFAPRDVNWPTYYNQPGLELGFTNTIPAAGVTIDGVPFIPPNVGIRISGCIWCEQAHQEPPNLGG